MRLYIILFLLLGGCTFRGNIPKFPDVPHHLTEDCADLTLIDDSEEKFSEVLKIITSNYGKYHECRIKVQLWNDWYTQQRKIYNNLK